MIDRGQGILVTFILVCVDLHEALAGVATHFRIGVVRRHSYSASGGLARVYFPGWDRSRHGAYPGMSVRAWSCDHGPGQGIAFVPGRPGAQ